MAIKKIMCFCGSGLGSSFVVEMNVKKALKALGVDGIEVMHSTLDDVLPGAADLFICGDDLAPHAAKAGKYFTLKNLVGLKEVQEKLKATLEEEGQL